MLGKLLRIDNVTAAEAARAILSVMPLDSFVDQPALRMEIVGDGATLPPVQTEVQAEIDAAEGRSWPMGSIERFAFYERAKNAYCVIQTGVAITQGPRSIGDNVYFGPGSKVIARPTIGNNVLVVANSVVMTDVPDNTTVIGVPARIHLPRGLSFQFGRQPADSADTARVAP